MTSWQGQLSAYEYENTTKNLILKYCFINKDVSLIASATQHIAIHIYQTVSESYMVSYDVIKEAKNLVMK